MMAPNSRVTLELRYECMQCQQSRAQLALRLDFILSALTKQMSCGGCCRRKALLLLTLACVRKAAMTRVDGQQVAH